MPFAPSSNIGNFDWPKHGNEKVLKPFASSAYTVRHMWDILIIKSEKYVAGTLVVPVEFNNVPLFKTFSMYISI